jgi:hypothetical protein
VILVMETGEVPPEASAAAAPPHGERAVPAATEGSRFAPVRDKSPRVIWV